MRTRDPFGLFLPAAAGLLLLVATCRTQTFVVDVQNGPGTNFTSIAAAVAAVPDGATLLVRPGSYAPFTIAAKGLTVLAEAGTTVTGSCLLRDTTPAQRLLLAGIDFGAPTAGAAWCLRVQDCQGETILASLTTPASVAPVPIISSVSFYPTGLQAARCDRLVLRDCDMSYVVVSQCVATIERCTFHGYDASTPNGFYLGPTAGLRLGETTADLLACDMVGGHGLPSSIASLAFDVALADVWLRSGSITAGGGGSSGSVSLWALGVVSSQLRIDPAVTITTNFGMPIYGNSTPTFTPLPSVGSNVGGVGGMLQATVATGVGDVVALFVALPGPPTALPGFAPRFWLDPATAHLRVLAVQQSGAPVADTLAVPNVAALRGQALAWQALVSNGSTVLASNASLAFVE